MLSERLKKKYFIGEENKDSLLLIGKRILKAIFIVLFVKGLRVFLIKNENIKNDIHYFISEVGVEKVLKFISLQFMFLGIVTLIICYLVKGGSIVNNKLFNYIILFCFVDLVLVYVFPEIYISIAKSIFMS
ncbi:hypothetical protein P4159_00585 [Bacillus thuringiensis]|uniref:Uncharacterized protein n=1 Tax=Bacillus thuringiensis subsp. kurstaki TaxID=29339 RepID=Q3YN47_BACTK|nr:MULTISPECIES: hypothetical protein [Bacillus cereus group]MEB9963608.1 hypothetical protein [Bacillus cereus]AAZ06598.1 hypothetical protein pAW63_028 [Bacillus thuringiensis serovar kurstaki]AGE81675.1 hypothetical protein HD73_7528 [Bacillus thuringiensis serovar kurstaki str. HD73]AND11257.1 hypothetical protein Bt4C1_28795 [Bacillus thuringiensis serovar alesti]EJV73140.1 hypothetical protein IG1_05889 [Bacillus cereus HD73]